MCFDLTLFLLTVMAEYEVPPRAINTASNATSIAGDGFDMRIATL